MPKLSQNVLYKGRVLKAGKTLTAAQAKNFGEHVFEKAESKSDESKDSSDGDKGDSGNSEE